MTKTNRCRKHTWSDETSWGKKTCTVCGHRTDVALLARLAKGRKTQDMVRAIRARVEETK